MFKSLLQLGEESKFAAQILALIIASHHSGLVDCLTPDGRDNFMQRMEKPDEETRLSEALSNIDERLRSRVDKLLSDPVLVQQVNTAIRQLCEPDDRRESLMLKVGFLVRYLFSCLIDADRQDTADFELPERVRLRSKRGSVSWSDLCGRLEKHLAGLGVGRDVDRIRQAVSAACLEFASHSRGLYQLTVPTGGGKTLSSLRFALHHARKHNMDRIIYVIPYTSIIDQNANVVRSILESQGEPFGSIVLENHSNLTPEEETPLQRLLAENWDAPVVFITMGSWKQYWDIVPEMLDLATHWLCYLSLSRGVDRGLYFAIAVSVSSIPMTVVASLLLWFSHMVMVSTKGAKPFSLVGIPGGNPWDST